MFLTRKNFNFEFRNMINFSQKGKLSKVLSKLKKAKDKPLSVRSRSRSKKRKKLTKKKLKNLDPIEKILMIVNHLSKIMESYKNISLKISKRNKLFLLTLGKRMKSLPPPKKQDRVAFLQAQIIEKMNYNYKEVNEAFKQFCVCIGDYFFGKNSKSLQDFIMILAGQNIEPKKKSLHQRIDRSRRGDNSGKKSKRFKTPPLAHKFVGIGRRRKFSENHPNYTSSANLIHDEEKVKKSKFLENISTPNFAEVYGFDEKKSRKDDIFGKRRMTRLNVDTRKLVVNETGNMKKPLGEEEGDNWAHIKVNKGSKISSKFSDESLNIEHFEISPMGMCESLEFEDDHHFVSINKKSKFSSPQNKMNSKSSLEEGRSKIVSDSLGGSLDRTGKTNISLPNKVLNNIRDGVDMKAVIGEKGKKSIGVIFEKRKKSWKKGGRFVKSSASEF